METNARTRVFDEHDDDGPTESEWFTIGVRRYKVFVVPSRLPNFVIEWCYGNLAGVIVGIIFFVVAARRSNGSWACRLYSQKERWYNGKYRTEGHEEFGSIDEAKARADELVEHLRGGVVPSLQVG